MNMSELILDGFAAAGPTVFQGGLIMGGLFMAALMFHSFRQHMSETSNVVKDDKGEKFWVADPDNDPRVVFDAKLQRNVFVAEVVEAEEIADETVAIEAEETTA